MNTEALPLGKGSHVKLRLDTTPFVDPEARGDLRLLFEGSVPREGGGTREFYLYLWIRDGRRVRAAQAVLDDETVLEYHEGGRIEAGKIGTRPMGRAVGQTATAQERTQLVELLCAARSEEFSDALGALCRAMRGEMTEAIVLTESEMQTLDCLRRGCFSSLHEELQT